MLKHLTKREKDSIIILLLIILLLIAMSFEGEGTVALKNHSLDDKIITAARKEFTEFGFQRASINKIAERAGVTTGAIYTRYKNKDALFCDLLQNILVIFQTKAEPIAVEYHKSEISKRLSDLLSAMASEEDVYLEILFDHYEEAVLLFCKSEGSSVESIIKELIRHKVCETVLFFERISTRPVDRNALELLMHSQFYFYRQLLESGYEKKEAVSCMKTVQSFMASGWKHLFEQLTDTNHRRA